jgi:uroporphyrinogen decarboxylase
VNDARRKLKPNPRVEKGENGGGLGKAGDIAHAGVSRLDDIRFEIKNDHRMRPEEWEIFKKAARLEKLDKIPMALIIDSPWIPGYLGVKHMDFYLDPELWFQSHLKIHREFPDIIFVPGWWMEYGMAAEPSALGAKIKFWADNTPSEYHTLYHIEDLAEFPEYEVENDAFMALTLHRIRTQRQRILDTGEILPFVTSRGPMCTAGFVRGTTNLMIDLVEKPEWAHKLLDLCTRLVIDWLKAQHKAMGNTVEGIFILDDIVGFVNEEHYKEFCHPYLKRICDAFPKDWVKLYHNDAEVQACLDHLPDCGFNMLNWGKQTDIAEVKERVGDRMCLMGNVNPLEVGVRGTPEEVRAATLDILEKGGDRGMILSVGGGTSPGMPKQNILAMLAALDEFNGKR